MYYGLATQHRPPTRPQPRIRWTRETPLPPLVTRWRR
jgi:hypothetical protein